jgi:hypothetical protein
LFVLRDNSAAPVVWWLLDNWLAQQEDNRACIRLIIINSCSVPENDEALYKKADDKQLNIDHDLD